MNAPLPSRPPKALIAINVFTIMQVEFKFSSIRGDISINNIITRLDDSIYGVDEDNYVIIQKLENPSYKKLALWDMKVVKINKYLNYIRIEFSTCISSDTVIPNIVISHLKSQCEGEPISTPMHNVTSWMARIETYKTMTMNLHNYIRVLDSEYYIDIFNPSKLLSSDNLDKTTINIPMYGGIIMYEANLSVEQQIAEFCIASKLKTLLLCSTTTINNWRQYQSDVFHVKSYLHYDAAQYDRVILCKPSNYIMGKFSHVTKPFWILCSKMPDDKYIEAIYAPRSLYSDDLCNSVKSRRSIRCGRKWSIDIQEPKVIVHRIKKVSSNNSLSKIQDDSDPQKVIQDEFIMAFKISSEFHKVDFTCVPCIDDAMCNVCYEQADCLTDCGHPYCYSCIVEWWRKSDSDDRPCPTCRSSMVPIKTIYPKVPQKIDYIKKLVETLDGLYVMVSPLMAIHDIIHAEIPTANVVDPHTCQNNEFIDVKHLIFLHPLIDSNGRQNKAFEESVINTFDEIDSSMTVHYILDEQFREYAVFEKEPYH